MRRFDGVVFMVVVMCGGGGGGSVYGYGTGVVVCVVQLRF